MEPRGPEAPPLPPPPQRVLCDFACYMHTPNYRQIGLFSLLSFLSPQLGVWGGGWGWRRGVGLEQLTA